MVRGTIHWNLVESHLFIELVLAAVNELQTEVLELGLVDPGVDDTIVHVLVFLVLVIELLVRFLALNVDTVQVPFFNLACQFLEGKTSIVLQPRLV